VDLTGASFTLPELAAASGLGEDVLEQLGEYGLLTATQVGGVAYFDEDGLAIANLAAGFARYGVEPRHLRLYKNTADREAGFIEQIVLPLVRQRNPEARQRAGRPGVWSDRRALAHGGVLPHAAIQRASRLAPARCDQADRTPTRQSPCERLCGRHCSHASTMAISAEIRRCRVLRLPRVSAETRRALAGRRPTSDRAHRGKRGNR